MNVTGVSSISWKAAKALSTAVEVKSRKTTRKFTRSSRNTVRNVPTTLQLTSRAKRKVAAPFPPPRCFSYYKVSNRNTCTPCSVPRTRNTMKNFAKLCATICGIIIRPSTVRRCCNACTKSIMLTTLVWIQTVLFVTTLFTTPLGRLSETLICNKIFFLQGRCVYIDVSMLRNRYSQKSVSIVLAKNVGMREERSRTFFFKRHCFTSLIVIGEFVNTQKHESARETL